MIDDILHPRNHNGLEYLIIPGVLDQHAPTQQRYCSESTNGQTRVKTPGYAHTLATQDVITIEGEKVARLRQFQLRTFA